MNSIQIQDKTIGEMYPPFIIAEMSNNHNQSLDRAMKIVEAASYAGVHAIKLQTYTPDTLTIDVSTEDFSINDPQSLWKGKTLYELYSQSYMPWEWHEPLFKKCRELGIIGFSTAYDTTAVDFLESLDVPCYKIASFENADLPLIRKVARTGKPIIISTGMATISELDDTIRLVRQEGGSDIILLKCTSAYPSQPKNAYLNMIPHMKNLFGCHVGLSDHTLGIGVAIASIALGARIIEKHFTLSRSDGGVDSAFSMEPEEMKILVQESEKAHHALGTISYGSSSIEKSSIKFRRSLYIIEDMKQGEIFTEKNLRSIRPGYGLSPKYYDIFLGKKVARDVKRGTPVSWDLI